MLVTVHASAFLSRGSGARRCQAPAFGTGPLSTSLSSLLRAGMDPACFPGAATCTMEAHSIIQARLVRSGQS